MGCPSSVYIGNNLTFSITTHDPETGILTDADAPPVYRVYEDEIATPILTGTMANLDDANTTGFYTEKIACTTANGFEDGKTYTVNIEATVDGNTGGIAYGFNVTTPVWSVLTRTLTQSAASVAAAVAGLTITILRGDTMNVALTGLGSLAGYVTLDFTVKKLTSDADTAAIIRIRKNASGTGDGLIRINGAAGTGANGSITIDDATDGDITITLEEADTDDLAHGRYVYDVQKITASGVLTLTSGEFVVTDDVTRLIT